MANMIAYFNYLEGGICLKINRLSRHWWLRRFFSVVSKLGDGWFYALPAAVIFALRGPESLPALLQVGLTALAGVFLYKVLK